MRSLYRLIKRLVFVLPVMWMLYAIHELNARPSAAVIDSFDNSPVNAEVKSVNEKKVSQILPVHEAHTHEPLKVDNKKFERDAARNIRNKEWLHESRKTWKHTVKENFKSVEFSNKEKLQHINRTGQLDKLSEIGGKLVEKNPHRLFPGVVFPTFNDKQEADGPGELGQGVKIDVDKLSDEEKSKYHQGWGANSFNQYASDMISIHRKLPDGRTSACKEQAEGYGQHLKEISVVIIFHNEAWSVLLRSVHSILSRTPENILREIILVDDFSTKEHLNDPLEKYFNTFPKVQIVRATKRQGLTRARLLGYHVSTAPIVVFLDSHIECFPGWAQPLISRISEDHTRVVFPSIEVINDEEFHTSSNTNVNQNGIFIFKDLTFQWQMVPQEEMNRRRNDADPLRSPTMPGGLFAISREFFDRLGTYDPGLDYWGGENIELSFKAWMCGGSVEMVTCSHIGHIFRRTNPIHWTHNIGSKNSIRVAEVWMDDYKNYFYERILYALDDYGNVTDRKLLRERLKCHSFEWYIRNVYPNIVLPSNIKYAGEIRSFAGPRCVDSMGGPQQNQPAPKLYPCHGQGYNQFWHVSEAGQIHQDEMHICHTDGQIATNNQCVPQGHTWKYLEDQTLLHVPTNKCLTASVTSDDLKLSNCTGNSYQKWVLQPRRSDLKFPQ